MKLLPTDDLDEEAICLTRVVKEISLRCSPWGVPRNGRGFMHDS